MISPKTLRAASIVTQAMTGILFLVAALGLAYSAGLKEGAALATATRDSRPPQPTTGPLSGFSDPEIPRACRGYTEWTSGRWYWSMADTIRTAPDSALIRIGAPPVDRRILAAHCIARRFERVDLRFRPLGS
jgi:hypothetical protein